MRGAPNLRLTSKFIIHSSYREKCPVFIIKSEEKFNVAEEREYALGSYPNLIYLLNSRTLTDKRLSDHSIITQDIEFLYTFDYTTVQRLGELITLVHQLEVSTIDPLLDAVKKQ